MSTVWAIQLHDTFLPTTKTQKIDTPIPHDSLVNDSQNRKRCFSLRLRDGLDSFIMSR